MYFSCTDEVVSQEELDELVFQTHQVSKVLEFGTA